MTQQDFIKREPDDEEAIHAIVERLNDVYDDVELSAADGLSAGLMFAAAVSGSVMEMMALKAVAEGIGGPEPAPEMVAYVLQTSIVSFARMLGEEIQMLSEVHPEWGQLPRMDVGFGHAHKDEGIAADPSLN